MSRPICIDLFCGLGGWAEGFLAEGYDVIGFDIERHDYGTGGYPGQLVLQDVTTLDGRQFRNAACIVASPPCQEFSYMAMPWSRAKQIARALRGQDEFPKGYTGSHTVDDLTALFRACFRIQREASEAAGHKIPLVVENVRGAEKWVGGARWHHGSYFLWGDVPALMPFTPRAAKVSGFRFDGSGRSFQTASVEASGQKVAIYSDPRRNGGKGAHLTCATENLRRLVHDGPASIGRDDGTKQGGEWWHDTNSITRRHSSRSKARKAASAMIAKIPFPLSSWIAQCFKPPEHPVVSIPYCPQAAQNLVNEDWRPSCNKPSLEPRIKPS